jgi:tetratricopeptide (TPR) repeat protein
MRFSLPKPRALHAGGYIRGVALWCLLGTLTACASVTPQTAAGTLLLASKDLSPGDNALLAPYYKIIALQAQVGDIRRAKATAMEELGVLLLASVAEEQAKMGDISGAIETLDEVIALVTNPASDLGHSGLKRTPLPTNSAAHFAWVYEEIALAHSRAGDMIEAERVVKTFSGKYRMLLYRRIIWALEAARDTASAEKAWQLAETAARSLSCPAAVAVCVLAARDDITGAQAALGRLETGRGWGQWVAGYNPYEALVEAQIRAGDMDGAAQTTKRAEDGNNRIPCFLLLADAYSARGKEDEAKNCVSSAEELIRTLDPDTLDVHPSRTYARIGAAHFALGNITDARKCFRDGTESAGGGIEYADGRWLGHEHEVLIAQLRAGDTAGAIQTANTADTNHEYADLAIAMTVVGDLANALDILKKMKSAYSLDSTRCDMVQHLLARSDFTAAEALALAQRISEYRVTSMATLARAHARAGNTPKARRWAMRTAQVFGSLSTDGLLQKKAVCAAQALGAVEDVARAREIAARHHSFRHSEEEILLKAAEAAAETLVHRRKREAAAYRAKRGRSQ